MGASTIGGDGRRHAKGYKFASGQSCSCLPRYATPIKATDCLNINSWRFESQEQLAGGSTTRQAANQGSRRKVPARCRASLTIWIFYSRRHGRCRIYYLLSPATFKRSGSMTDFNLLRVGPNLSRRALPSLASYSARPTCLLLA